MKERDEHFWIKDVVNRLQSELVPKNKSWSAVLTAITQLKAERNCAMLQVHDLKEDLARCRHQASYSIGNEEALANQLAKVREIANEALNT